MNVSLLTIILCNIIFAYSMIRPGVSRIVNKIQTKQNNLKILKIDNVVEKNVTQCETCENFCLLEKTTSNKTNDNTTSVIIYVDPILPIRPSTAAVEMIHFVLF